MTTPSSEAMPNSARNPTQTATLRLIGWTWNRSRIDVPNTEKFRNQGCPYSQIMMKPPAQATTTPEKTSGVVGTDLNCR